MFLKDFVYSKCKQNIGMLLKQKEDICSNMDALRELTCLCGRVSSGG